MRCYCCNRSLSDAEATMKHPDTKEFLDMCKKCLEFMPFTPEPGQADLDDSEGKDDEYY